MDAERARAYLLHLPHVVETVQWGGMLVFWAADKAIGGKIFAVISLEGERGTVVSFAAGHEHAAELLELDGMRRAPYFGRLGWVAAEHWQVLRAPVWQAEFAAAHALTVAKMPARTRAVLALSEQQQKALIAVRRRVLASKAAAERPRIRKAHQPSR